MTNYRNRIKALEYVPAGDLVAHPGNWRDHPAAQAEALKGVLKEVGIAGALLAYRSERQGGALVVIDGHLRKDAAPQKWPVLVLDVDDAEADYLLATHDPLAAMATADAGALDALLSSVNSGEAAVQAMLAELAAGAGLYAPKNDSDAEPQIDRAEELREQWGVETGQLWRLPSRTPGQEHRLICGDCTDAATVERVMEGERARLVATSPPYPGADMWDVDGTVKDIERVGLNALRVVTLFVGDGCPILWNVANTPIGTQAGVVHTTTTTTKLASEELGLLCYGEIIWAKPVQHLTPLSFMMRPVVPNLIHEYIMIFYKGKRKQRESSSGLSDEDKAIRTKSVWEISPESAERVEHKAPFPHELARRCLALWSLEGDVILEPFSGSGTTIIAAENLSRQCRAVEISPGYVAVALQRYADTFGITPELID